MELELTQDDVAEQLGTTQTQVSVIERGTRGHPPDLERRIDLARILGAPDLIFTDEELADAG